MAARPRRLVPISGSAQKFWKLSHLSGMEQIYIAELFNLNNKLKTEPQTQATVDGVKGKEIESE